MHITENISPKASASRVLSAFLFSHISRFRTLAVSFHFKYSYLSLCLPVHISGSTVGTGISVGIWVNVECNIGIVSACLPILRPLFTEKYHSSPAAFLSRFLRSISSTVPSNCPSQSLGSDSTAQPQKQEKQIDEEKAEIICMWSRTNKIVSSKRRLWGSESTVVENLSMSAKLHEGRLREHPGWYRNFCQMGTTEMQRDDEIEDLEQVSLTQSWRGEGRSESPTSFKSDKWNLMPSKARWNRENLMQ